MIIVTGGAGFIGSNLVHELNRRGIDDIIVVDDLTDGRKFTNISQASIADYQDFEEFRAGFASGSQSCSDIERIYHLGACSTTTEWDGRMMLDRNYAYTRDLIDFCAHRSIPIVYASSAAVYGKSVVFAENGDNEHPLNVYGYSKQLIDSYVSRHREKITSQIVGLRYFNVYGPREQHKDSMASVAFHFNRQILESQRIGLFDGSHGYAAGEQCRDFVHVDDAVATTLWFADRPDCSGVFNCGTGTAETFNQVAAAVLEWHGGGRIEYVPFPENLREVYQSFTQADLSLLRGAGCEINFRGVSEGVRDYLDWLNS
jgi:ADP-L-glycero-D-manno-heptose 6-epimerase